MRTYFMKYRFTHPVKEDFLKTIEEVSGKDLRWYFNQAVYGTQVLDYEVTQARLVPGDLVRGRKEKRRQERRQGYGLPFHRVAASQGRVCDADRGGDQVRERRKSSRTLGRREPLDEIHLREEGESWSRRRSIRITRAKSIAITSTIVTLQKAMARRRISWRTTGCL